MDDLDALFDDVASRIEAEEFQAGIGEARELGAAEAGAVSLVMLLRAAIGQQLELLTRGGVVHLSVEAVSDTVVLGRPVEPGFGAIAVPTRAIMEIGSTPRYAVAAQSSSRALRLGAVLRRYVGNDVVVTTNSGALRRGVLRRVGRDWCEVAGRVIAFEAISAVRMR